MKKLGLVGGIGPESTIPYYHDIVYGVQKKLGDSVFPPIIIDSINVFQVLSFCQKKDYAGLTVYISTSIQNLAAGGADFAALTGNTPHIIFQELQNRSPIPLVSIIDATCQDARDKGYSHVFLLGTAFTMSEDFFKIPFRKSGIRITVPDPSEQQWVHDKISSELELGIKREETLVGFQALIQKAKTNGAEAVILGCTELPLLLSDKVSPLPCLNTMSIHIQSLIQRILK